MAPAFFIFLFLEILKTAESMLDTLSVSSLCIFNDVKKTMYCAISAKSKNHELEEKIVSFLFKVFHLCTFHNMSYEFILQYFRQINYILYLCDVLITNCEKYKFYNEKVSAKFEKHSEYLASQYLAYASSPKTIKDLLLFFKEYQPKKYSVDNFKEDLFVHIRILHGFQQTWDMRDHSEDEAIKYLMSIFIAVEEARANMAIYYEYRQKTVEFSKKAKKGKFN